MITAEILARHDRPSPRYTSYPTAVDFTDDFGPDDFEECLRRAAAHPKEPLSMYVHLPFCRSRCSFCACHVVVARDPRVAEAYLDRVIREIPLLAEGLGPRRRLSQLHWGGGTPTSYPPNALERLQRAVRDQFDLLPGAEVAVEVDPRVTTAEHLDSLAGLGFDRLSMGVQDLDPTVQRLIGREQTAEETFRLYEHARSLGFRSINLDLIHGLPGQTLDTMEATLDSVVAMRPDRLAVYSFAFVPWMRPHQRRMDTSNLPTAEVKMALLARVSNRLTAAGYRAIGMDHFALPGDDLAVAAAEGTLGRNFMGYTPSASTEVVAIGTSGISDVAGSYAQGHRRLASYLQEVDAGRHPIERGYRLDADDLLRRDVIMAIMCRWGVDLAAVTQRHGLDAAAYFAAELEALTAPGGLVDEGLATVDDLEVRLTELGHPFVRRLARVFDAHADRRTADGPTFSRAI